MINYIFVDEDGHIICNEPYSSDIEAREGAKCLANLRNGVVGVYREIGEELPL